MRKSLRTLPFLLLFSLFLFPLAVSAQTFCAQDPVPFDPAFPNDPTKTQQDLRMDPDYDRGACPANDVQIISARIDTDDVCNTCDSGDQITADLYITVDHGTQSGGRYLGVFGMLTETLPDNSTIMCDVARCGGELLKASDEIIPHPTLAGEFVQEIYYGEITFTCGSALQLSDILLVWTAANGACPITNGVMGWPGNNPNGKYCFDNPIIDITPPLNAVADASCNTGNEIDVDLTVTGGSGSFTYLWAPGGATTMDLTNALPNTLYTVTVTDLADMCTTSTSVTTPPPCFVCPTLSNESPDFTTCVDSQGQTLSVDTDIADIDIEFYIFNSAQVDPYGVVGTQIGTAVTPVGGTATSNAAIVGLTAGTYYAYAVLDLDDPELTDPQCRPFAETVITIDPLEVPTFDPVGPICEGDALSALPTTSNNNITGSWSPALDNTQTTVYTFTPDPGQCADTSELTIIVNPLPTVTFTAPADLCIDAGLQSGLGGGSPSGAGGVYSGIGVTDDGNGMTYSFDPAAAGVGTHTITYTFTNGNSCTDSASDDVEVFGLPVVTFTAPADLCIDAGVQAGLGGGSPTGGVYSGPGVTDDGNGMTYSFDPAAAGVGTHTITYTFTNANSCTDSASDDVEVFGLPVVTFTALADLCIDEGIQSGLGGGSPTGGVYSGPGVTDDGNGMTYSFDPAVAGVGTHTITYTFTNANSCTDSASDDVEVFGLPVVTFTALADLCIDAGVQAGLGGGSPTGGVYSGPGVTDDGNGMTYSFDPAAAGVGTHTITYTFTNANSCTDSASDDVEVFGLPVVTFTAPADLCIDEGVQTGLGGGSPTGGVYSGPGVTDDGNGMTYSFDPAAAGVGTHTITYTFTNANSCTDSASDDVEVFGLPVVTFTALADLCIDEGIQSGLGGGSPTGGVYSGPGVTDDGNGMTYSFDPAAAGVGTHTITYTFTNANSCTDSASDDVEVFGLPVVTFTALADLCIDAGVQAGLGGGSPTGGVYSGPGVTDDGNGMTYSFDPAAAGVGTHTITYTFTNANSCTDSASDDVEVFGLPVVTFTALADLCIDEGIQSGLGGGSPTGGVYSGPGVTDDGNGMTYSFDPAAAGVGTHTITYTFTNANSCTDSASDDVEVFGLPTITIAAAPECAPDLLSYSLSVNVSSGTVISSGGGTVVDNGGGNWTISGIPTGNDTILTVTDANSCDQTLMVSAPDCSCPVVEAPVSGGDQAECDSGQTLTATATAGAGEVVEWYDMPMGGMQVTPELTGVGTVTFYAEARNTTNNCVSSTRTPVTLTIYDLPDAPGTSDLVYCVGDSPAAITSVVMATGTLNWYSDMAGTMSIAEPVIDTSTASINTYYVTQTDNNQCESATAPIMVTVNPLPDPPITTDLVFCEGDATVLITTAITAMGTLQWYSDMAGTMPIEEPIIDTSIVGSNTYFVTQVDVNLCESETAPITVTVNPIATAEAGDSQVVCGLVVVNLSATANGPGMWSGGAGMFADPTMAATTYTPDVSEDGATVQLTWTTSDPDQDGPCTEVSDTVDITFNEEATAEAGEPQTVCGLVDVNLSAMTSGPGMWSGGAGMFADPTMAATTYTPDASEINTTVQLTWTTFDPDGPDGPCPEVFDTVDITFNEEATAEAGDPQVVCGLLVVNLSATTSGPGMWSGGAGMFADPTMATTTYTPDVSEDGTTVQLTWTTFDPDQDGPCVEVFDTVDITFNEEATAEAGAPQTFCELQDVNLSATTNGSGVWSGGLGMFADPTMAATIYSPNASELGTTVQLTWTTFDPDGPDGPCVEVFDTVDISFNEEAMAEAGDPQTVCILADVNLSATASGPGMWSGGAGMFADPSMAATAYTPDASEVGTTVQLTWTTFDPDGPDGPCVEVFDTVEITIDEEADAGADNDILVCESTVVDLTTLVSVAGGDFSETMPSGGLSGSTFDTTGLTAGFYEIIYTATSPNQICDADTALITIEVEAQTVLNVCTSENVDFCGNVGGPYNFYWPAAKQTLGTVLFSSTAQDPLVFTEYPDGTALIEGNTLQGNCTVSLHIKLVDKKNWAEWSADGGSFKNQGCSQVDNTLLRYYVIDDENSFASISGPDCPDEGMFVISQRPDPDDQNTPNLGVHVGPGGALYDTNVGAEGIAGWGWMGDENNPQRWIMDFNFLLDCMEEPICEIPLLCEITDSEDVSCVGGNDGSATVSPSGGTTPYTYLWESPDHQGFQAFSQSVSGLEAGYYVVTVWDALQNKTQCMVKIGAPEPPYAGEDGMLTICPGEDVSEQELFDALGGNPDAGGIWSPAFNGPGIYTYTVGEEPCDPDTATVEVKEEAQPFAGDDGALTICEGETVTENQLFAALGGSPDQGGSWSPALAGQGTYTYTVGGGNCPSDSAEVQVTEEPARDPGTNGELFICVGETVTVQQLFDALGGDPESGGTWSPLPDGVQIYTYTLPSTQFCPEVSAQVTVIGEPGPDAGEDAQLTVCEGYMPTEQELFDALGGMPDMNGTWSSGMDSNGRDVYYYTVSGQLCPEDIAQVVINIEQPPNAGENGALTICEGTSVTSEQLFMALGGMPDQGGTWLEPLAGEGTYTYTFEGLACGVSAQVVVTEEAQLSAGEDGALVIQQGEMVSEMELFEALGPNADLGGTWNPTPPGGAGTYTYTHAATQVCPEISATVEVTEEMAQQFYCEATVVSHISCNGANDGSASVGIVGGIPNYSILWDNGQMTAIATGLTPGDHSVTISDGNGRDTVCMVFIEEPDPLAVEIRFLECRAGADGRELPVFEAVVTGGTADYTINWDNGAVGPSAAHFTNLGTAGVTVEDANGCMASNTYEFDQFICSVPVSRPLPNATDLKVYHVPFTNTMGMDLDIAYDAQMKLEFMDMSGKRVLVDEVGQLKAGFHKMNCNIMSLPAEVYLLRVHTGRELLLRKVYFIK